MEELLLRELDAREQTHKSSWFQKVTASLSAASTLTKKAEPEAEQAAEQEEAAAEPEPSLPAEEAPAPAEEPAAPAPAEEPADSTPAGESPAPAETPEPPPAAEPELPVAEAAAAAAPDSKPASTPALPGKAAVKLGKKVTVSKRKKTGAAAQAAPEPECEVKGFPGSMLGLPYEFETGLRVTAAAEAFTEGVALRFCVRTAEECRIYLLAHGSDGEISLILPGDKEVDNLVFPSVESKFPGLNHPNYHLMVEPPFGQESIVLLAVATTSKCDFDKVLRELIKKDPMGEQGSFENAAIEHFRTKYPKQANLTWSSAVLRFNTYPKPAGSGA